MEIAATRHEAIGLESATLALCDLDPSATWEEALAAAQAGRFVAINEALPLLARPDASCWYRVALVFEPPQDAEAEVTESWVVEVGSSLLEELEVIALVAGSPASDARRPRPREVSTLPYHLARRLPPLDEGEVTLLLHAVGPPTPMRLALWPEPVFERSSRGQRLLLGLFYGALFAMVLHNLAILLLVRDRTNLYYVLLLAALTTSLLCWDGFALRYLWPGWTQWNRSALLIFDALTAIAAAFFTRSYLATAEHHRGLDRALLALAALAGLTALLSAPVTWSLGLEAVALVAGLGPVLLLVVAVRSLRSGNRSARYYLAALALLLIGLVVEATPASLGASAQQAAYGTYAGSFLMAVLSSLGVVDRYQRLVVERERIRAENRILLEFSYRDPLTGIANRRRFDEQLAVEWRRAIREREPLSLILIDVDHFKRYNDTYGHQAGDDCLRQVATAVAERAARPADLVARYGGEELVVLLPQVDGAGAASLAESMREAVAALELAHSASPTAPILTISLGVATATPHLLGGEGETGGSALLEEADRALYRAKEEGRNRVVCREPRPGV